MNANASTDFETAVTAMADALRASEHDVGRADRVIRARLVLWHRLIEQGWQPPADVTANMARDALVLTESVGTSESLAETVMLRSTRRPGQQPETPPAIVPLQQPVTRP